jgi:hypothetical protein
MDYVDPQVIKGFMSEVESQLAEVIEFSTQMRINEGEKEENELRQTAQDALFEIMTPLLGATSNAYRKSPLGRPDFDAITTIFRRLAIRAELVAMCARSPEHPNQFPTITIETRKGVFSGTLYDMLDHEGQFSVHMSAGDDEQWIPVDSILKVVENAA